MRLQSDKRYFWLAGSLLALEVLIALYLHDKIIRPYVGDILAPIFLYCLIRSCFAISYRNAAFLALLTAYLIESMQYIHLLELLEWQHNRVVAVVLGSRFEWIDLVAYTAGIALVLLVERRRIARQGALSALRHSAQ